MFTGFRLMRQRGKEKIGWAGGRKARGVLKERRISSCPLASGDALKRGFKEQIGWKIGWQVHGGF